MTVILSEEVLGGVLNAAEHLQGSIVAAEAGAIEALRWAGALPLLLRDFGVTKIVSADALWACQSAEDVVTLLRTPRWEPTRLQPEHENELAHIEPIEHVCVVVTGFLWDYETRLIELLQLGAVQHLTVCSSLSERAHECYDFDASALFHTPSSSNRSRKMDFLAFASLLSAHNTCVVESPAPPLVAKVPPPTMGMSSGTAVAQRSDVAASDNNNDDDDDDWGWTDDSAKRDANHSSSQQTPTPQALPPPIAASSSAPMGVNVVQLPLHFAALLSSKAQQHVHEPSVFVLCHPTCAAAFPLLLSDVVNALSASSTAASTVSTSSGFAAVVAPPLPTYAHVRDVQPMHIPSAFRRSLKLLAQTLGEVLVGMRLDFRERIFALGATSLKIGHTLQHIMGELQEDTSIHTIQSHEMASVVILDRTSDLATPTSFSVSLLDRILALLPQTPIGSATAPPSKRKSNTVSKTRKHLHVTEIFPLHGCDPTPLSVSHSLLDDDDDALQTFQTSPFLANVCWRGGASLCHPTIPSGASVFRSLAFRPAKLALRDLDKRLQAIEHELVAQRKITKIGSTRRPGEKKPSARGRDVVLRRICNILDAGEPTTAEHSSLVELGILVLETLERMERSQQRWDTCRERALRQQQLHKQNGSEWILPELADAIQRDASATAATTANNDAPTLTELLTLLVHAFALSSSSSGGPIEAYTLQMICAAVSASILQTAVTSPESVQALFPSLYVEIVAFVTRQQQAQSSPSVATASAAPVAATAAARVSHGDDFDDQEWDWNDNSANSPTSSTTQSMAPSANTLGASSSADEVLRREAKAAVEAFVERLVQNLKECAQLTTALSGDDASGSTSTETPSSLIAQLCSAVTNPGSGSRVPELEHIVDASEQLTRAGIDLLRSGFSRFGFGGASRSHGASSSQLQQLAASKVIVVFVVGGITFEEIQQVHDALGESASQQIILGGTTITNNEIVVGQLLKSLNL